MFAISFTVHFNLYQVELEINLAEVHVNHIQYLLLKKKKNKVNINLLNIYRIFG